MNYSDNTRSHRASTSTIEMAAGQAVKSLGVQANMPNNLNLAKGKVKKMKACAMCGQSPCICNKKKMKAGGPGSGRRPGAYDVNELKDLKDHPFEKKINRASDLADKHFQKSEGTSPNAKLHEKAANHFSDASDAYEGKDEVGGDKHMAKGKAVLARMKAK